MKKTSPAFALALFFLCATIIFSGCPSETPSQPAKNGTEKNSSTSPEDDEPTDVPIAEDDIPEDDPEAVAKLEGAGAVLKKDENGLVVEANCKPAQMTNELMPLLKGIPNVVKLDLENGQFDNDALAVLEHLPALKTINMRQCSKIDEGGLAHLKKVPQLERLLLLYTRTNNAGLAEVANLENLVVLDLRGTKIGDEGVNSLTKLDKLVDLKIRSTSVSGESMATIGKMTKLRYLALEDAGVGDEHIGELAPLKNLVSFNIMRTFVSDEGLAHFGDQKFQDVRLRDTAVGGPGLEALKGSIPTLKYLDLSETLIDNDGLSYIAPFTNLETLSVWNGTMDDDGLEPLTALTKLKSLDIHGCRGLSSDCAEHLMKMKNLEVLNIAESNFDDDGLAKLAELEHLKSISIGQTGVTSEGVNAFKEKHPNCTVNE